MNEATANPAPFFFAAPHPVRYGIVRGSLPDRGLRPCHQDLRGDSTDQLGARIALICQLTGIEKTVAKRLYRELTGTSPPRGQTPFTDAWYVESDLRMLQAAIVWRLYECLDRPGRSKARILIYVYEAYRQLVRKPVLDLIRVAYVPRLVAMRKWQERLCEECHLSFLRPVECLNTICPGSGFITATAVAAVIPPCMCVRGGAGDGYARNAGVWQYARYKARKVQSSQPIAGGEGVGAHPPGPARGSRAC